MKYTTFDFDDEMFSYLQKNWNRLIVPGTYWACEDNIVGICTDGLCPREDYEDEEEYLAEVEMMKSAVERGYIFGKWYSEYCPEGELGSNHITNCVPITKDFFDDTVAWLVGG